MVQRRRCRRVTSHGRGRANTSHTRRGRRDVRRIRRQPRRSASPDRALRGVLAILVLQHLSHPATFIAEIRRCLRPGGHLLITAPVRDDRVDKAVRTHSATTADYCTSASAGPTPAPRVLLLVAGRDVASSPKTANSSSTSPSILPRTTNPINRPKSVQDMSRDNRPGCPRHMTFIDLNLRHSGYELPDQHSQSWALDGIRPGSRPSGSSVVRTRRCP